MGSINGKRFFLRFFFSFLLSLFNSKNRIALMLHGFYLSFIGLSVNAVSNNEDSDEYKSYNGILIHSEKIKFGAQTYANSYELGLKKFQYFLRRPSYNCLTIFYNDGT